MPIIELLNPPTELAHATGVSKHTPRYYERVGLVLLVNGDRSSGHRRYADSHVQWIAFLRNLRACGMPVREMGAYARLVATVRGRRVRRCTCRP